MSMRLRLIGMSLAALFLLGAVALYGLGSRTRVTPVATLSFRFDRILVLVLESYRSDKVDPAAIPSNLFLTKLAAENRFAMNYYGVWSASLPNYIAMIGGDTFNVTHNHGSCFDPAHEQKCNGLDAPNLVDQLEKAKIAWEGLFESSRAPVFWVRDFQATSHSMRRSTIPSSISKALRSTPPVSSNLSPSS